MARFLFWNLNRRPIAPLVVRLVGDHRVDVVVLAESTMDLPQFLRQLTKLGQGIYREAPGAPTRLVICTRYPPRFIRPIRDSDGISIKHLVPPIGGKLLFVCAHLPSKRYRAEDDQTLDATLWASMIEEAERRVGHSRTIVIGDFNMNPWEPGVVGAAALHAVMDRTVAGKAERTVQRERRPFFYNPMWSRLGDGSPGPPGTCYFSKGKQVEYFWNTFDQVLVRPALAERFSHDDVAVLTRAGGVSLLEPNGGRPDANLASDHLPLLFVVNTEGGTDCARKYVARSQRPEDQNAGAFPA